MKNNVSKYSKYNKQETESQEDNNQGTEAIDEFTDKNNEIESNGAENIKAESDESENDEERHMAEYRRSVLRIVAGGYLIYLSYSGITDIIEEVDSSTPWYFYLVYGVFAILGVLFVFDGVRSQFKNKK